ncbi:MAG: CheR family methyltransferase [Opitutaceae bacterium]
MRDSDFEFIRTLVYERSRISLDSSKRELVGARVAKRLRVHRMESVTDYCRMLRDPGQETERVRLIDVISTNHTFFFREAEHFSFTARTIVPEMLRRSRAEPWPRLRAWSAACSSGEEPYSLAITLAEELRTAGWGWRVEATDISHPVLDKARLGIYPAEAVDHSVPPWARVYFLRGVGPQEGMRRVRPAIRAGVAFRQLNLLEGSADPGPFHVIFCRNVMIYFDRTTQNELVRRLADRLIPGGYLLVGHSETLTGIDHSLEPVLASVYRRPGGPR